MFLLHTAFHVKSIGYGHVAPFCLPARIYVWSSVFSPLSSPRIDSQNTVRGTLLVYKNGILYGPHPNEPPTMASSLDKVDFNEKQGSTEHHEISKSPVVIKLDGSGLPLVPQPDASDTDPLNYPNVRPLFLLKPIKLTS